MSSITSWTRLEPVSRNAEMTDSLQAKIYDPLWLLTRQWQLGEFQGEDNGSPVLARWRGEAGRITRYHSGVIASVSPNGQRYDPRRVPLETLVERETVRPAVKQTKSEKLRLAVEAGQHFLRILSRMREQNKISDNYHAAFIRQYPFTAPTNDERATLDTDSLNFITVMVSRVPDGRKLDAAFRKTGSGGVIIEQTLNIAGPDESEIKEAAQVWREWYESLFSEPAVANPSWLTERLEYCFSVGARLSDGERVLTAPEYYEGHLDWYAFDANKGTLGAATDNATAEVVSTAIPAPVSYRGMPAPRFWEFEDAQVDFGSVDAGPTDLIRLLLVEFALTYGNDWFVIPLELDVGSLHRTRSLVITDTFGVRTLIKPSSELPAPHSLWRMFEHSRLRGVEASQSTSNLFFLPPSLVKSLEGRSVEEVLFLRDEMANMAWGVERIVESVTEQPLNRFEQQRPLPTAPAPAQGGKLVYRLATEVPDYWVPLMPVKTAEGLRLQRGKVLRLDGRQGFVNAKGRILNPEPPSSGAESLRIFEEEVPREGVRVTRHYQLTRWHDGSTHLWIGRRKKVGSGEGSSGLSFDSLNDQET